MAKQLARPSEEQVSEWFQKLDSDGSGKIDSTELRVFVKKVYERVKKDPDDAKIDADTAVCIYKIIIIAYVCLHLLT